jgi:hypothetical protein
MTSRVSFGTSDGDAEGFCCLTCQWTPINAVEIQRFAGGLPCSPIPIFSRAVDLPVNGLYLVELSSEDLHAQTPTVSEAGLKIVTAPTLCRGSSQHASRHRGGRRFCIGIAS